MKVSPLAGKPVDQSQLIDVPRLITAYFACTPDPDDPAQRVAFGTSGHRGSAFDNAFNESHILAISQAICLHRKSQNISGPLFLGMDTHALSVPAFASAIEVLAANGVETMVDSAGGYTPTPAISHAILTYNRGRKSGLADGIVITPSHNPPSDGGFKYNPPNGGPADSAVTDWIQNTANAFLKSGLAGVNRVPYERARSAATLHKHDYVGAYVGDLANVVDMEAIRGAGVRVGIDPLGGAAVHYWPAVIEKYGIKATVVSDTVDSTFRFMTADWDGKIRMDCSSPYAMTRLLAMRDRFDVAFANDTDADRHGIVTRASGLMNPNHYLAVAISYLFRNRSRWRKDAAVGKTVVSSSMIDRIAASLERKLIETPVGFKWFVDGLIDGSVGFSGEESAGASFLRLDGTVWTTDKDGLILGLLAAEITARAGRDPGALYDDLTREFGTPAYGRIDAPATLAQKEILSKLAPAQLSARELAGEKILETLTVAPGNGAAIGGIKVIAESGWFAARPSGTEEVYKIYAESFRGVDHLHRIQAEAQELIARVFQQAESNQRNRGIGLPARHVILCINVGSSSCKFSLYAVSGAGESMVAEGAADRIGGIGGKINIRDASGGVLAESDREFAGPQAAVDAMFDEFERLKLPSLDAVGHRMVHGGVHHTAPEIVTPALLADLKGLIAFAPLHMPGGIEGIEAVSARYPKMPQVVCFDTAFHRGMPERAERFPLPRELWDAGVRRYGFHGISYEYIMHALGAAVPPRLIIAHLGNGASMAAVENGRPLDTTMGFTPAGGFMMGTRPGDLDPGVMLYLLAQKTYEAAQLAELVNQRSGLIGVSGLSSDVKTLLDARAVNRDAAMALEMFCYQIRKSIGALAAALGGLDLLVFTGGIGEHAAAVRAEICDGLAHLGLAIDPARNNANEGTISAIDSRCRVEVIPTNENLMVARNAARLVFPAG